MTKFTTMNNFMNDLDESGSIWRNTRNPIKLAIEATTVPNPPMFDPMNNSRAWSVNVEIKIVDGTFEMNWLKKNVPNRTCDLVSNNELTSSRITSMCAKLFVAMKKKKNVTSKPKSTILNIERL